MRLLSVALLLAGCLAFTPGPARAQVPDEEADLTKFLRAKQATAKIVMATGSSQYFELAERYRRVLERYGVQYEVQRRTEGFATLRALLDPNSGINAGFIKGGLVGSLQGRLATEKAKGRYAEYNNLRSVGRLFSEPIWVYSRGDLPIRSLRDLKGKKILTSTRESGARRIALQLLRANGIEKSNAALIDEDLPADAAPLFDGRADAAITIAPPDSEKMQALLRVPGIRLMDFSEEAESYENRFPALGKVVLRKGAIEFSPLIPSEDMTLLTTSVALVIRSDMHPALASVLTHAVVSNPKPSTDREGDPVLFHRSGEFPSANDPEFQVAEEAKLVYRAQDIPVVLRLMLSLFPFSVAAFMSENWNSLPTVASRAGIGGAARARNARSVYVVPATTHSVLVSSAQGSRAEHERDQRGHPDRQGHQIGPDRSYRCRPSPREIAGGLRRTSGRPA